MAATRTANLLGALSQLTMDGQLGAIHASSGLNPTEAAALITVNNDPGQPIEFLHHALKRSHSATVRLVDKLEAKGLLVRDTADDGRAVALVLSKQGQSCVDKILKARDRSIHTLIDFLNEEELAALDGLMAKLIAASVLNEHHAYQICRLCDADRCDVCPVEEAFADEA